MAIIFSKLHKIAILHKIRKAVTGGDSALKIGVTKGIALSMWGEGYSRVGCLSMWGEGYSRVG